MVRRVARGARDPGERVELTKLETHSDETTDIVDLVVVRPFNDMVPGDRLDGLYRSARVDKWLARGVVRAV